MGESGLTLSIGSLIGSKSQIKVLIEILKWPNGINISIHPKNSNDNDFIEEKINIDSLENDLYLPLITKLLRDKIKQRDENKCILCDRKSVKMEVHHIDWNWNNNSAENLVTLCHGCHNKAHRKKSKDRIKAQLRGVIK